METVPLEINEEILFNLYDQLETQNQLLLNINSWFEVLVVGLIAVIIVYLFYLALRNFI